MKKENATYEQDATKRTPLDVRRALNRIDELQAELDGLRKSLGDQISSVNSNLTNNLNATNSKLEGSTKWQYKSNGGTDGTNGYICIAELTVKAAYLNAPMCWLIFQRSKMGSWLNLNFANRSDTTPPVATFTFIGSIEAYAITNGSTTQVWVLKSEGYDTVYLMRQYISTHESNITVTNPMTFATSLPSGTTLKAEKYA